MGANVDTLQSCHRFESFGETEMRQAPLLLMICVLPLFGCAASARYVLKDSQEGIIAVARSSGEHREKAHELMRQHFPGGYSIVREEEVPVGVATHVHQHETGSRSVVTRDKTEYRIHYVSHETDGSAHDLESIAK